MKPASIDRRQFHFTARSGGLRARLRPTTLRVLVLALAVAAALLGSAEVVLSRLQRPPAAQAAGRAVAAWPEAVCFAPQAGHSTGAGAPREVGAYGRLQIAQRGMRLATAIGACPPSGCTTDSERQYYGALADYVSEKKRLVEAYDVEFGAAGVAVVHALYETGDDERLAADVRARLASGWLKPDRLWGGQDATVLFATRPNGEFRPCAP